MRVIQERDANNCPQVAYTRGLDLSGTFEGGAWRAKAKRRRAGLGAWWRARAAGQTAGSHRAGCDGSPDAFCRQRSSGRPEHPIGREWLGRLWPRTRRRTPQIVMKGQMKRTVWFLALLSVTWLPPLASAHYDPTLQRWINRDPLGDESVLTVLPRSGSQLPGWYLRHEAMQNAYRFGWNSPMTAIDADGRAVIIIVAGGGVLIQIGQGVTIGLTACMLISSCRAALEAALARGWERAREICRPKWREPDYNKICDRYRDACVGSGQDCFSCWRECQSTGSWPSYKCDPSKYQLPMAAK